MARKDKQEKIIDSIQNKIVVIDNVDMLTFSHTLKKIIAETCCFESNSVEFILVDKKIYGAGVFEVTGTQIKW